MDSGEPNKRGRLYVFEGPDDVGKTTLAEALAERLSLRDTRTRLLSFPGREPRTISELIYRLYHDPVALGVANILPITMQVMVTAAHIEVIEARIKPLIESGVDIVLDRFWWSTWVYATEQGLPGAARDIMIDLELRSWADLTPDRIFLVLRTAPLLPQSSDTTWQRLATLYKQLYEIQKESQPITIIENEGTSSEAFELVTSML